MDFYSLIRIFAPMINQQLLNPKSIVVIGGSNNVHKPGGSIVRNIKNGGFGGDLHIVNPKEDEVQGIKAFHDVKDIPPTELAVLVVAAKFCPDYVDYLCAEKGTKAFVIISAGFGEETKAGAELEQRILDTCKKYGAALIGPNCIGLLNRNHHSVFTLPIPNLNPQGVDFVSGSGATAVFILESAVIKGLQFNSVWSIGNGKQIGIEDVLQYMDEHFDAQTDSKVKLLYIEMPHSSHQGRIERERKSRCIEPHGCHRIERLGGRGAVPQGGHRTLFLARGVDYSGMYLHPARAERKELRNCYSRWWPWSDAYRCAVERWTERAQDRRA